MTLFLYELFESVLNEKVLTLIWGIKKTSIIPE